MQFQLTSAFSTKITWLPVKGTGTYSVQWRQGDLVKETKCEGEVVVLLNLVPDTTYDVRILSSNDTETTGTFKTSPESEPNLDNLYESIKLEDGTYDATQFDKNVHDIFLKYFNDVVKNGDTIYTSVVLKGSAKNIQTQAVVEGTTVSVSGDKNLFLPFSTDSVSKNQVVTLKNDVNATAKDVPTDQTSYAPNVTLTYSPLEDSFVMGDRVYKVGDRFELFGRAVTVADGSIVLVFEDTVQMVYPFDISSATNVTTTLGSQFAKNLTINVMNIVGTRVTGSSGNTHQSGWLYDSTADTISEATRIVHTIDENGETGGLSIGVLHTDASSNSFLEPVIQCAPTSTTISAQDASDNTVSATFNSLGLSFDAANSAVYFGSSQTFRIIMIEGTPNVLSVQSLDSVSGEYVSRMDFSDGS